MESKDAAVTKEQEDKMADANKSEKEEKPHGEGTCCGGCGG